MLFRKYGESLTLRHSNSAVDDSASSTRPPNGCSSVSNYWLVTARPSVFLHRVSTLSVSFWREVRVAIRKRRDAQVNNRLAHHHVKTRQCAVMPSIHRLHLRPQFTCCRFDTHHYASSIQRLLSKHPVVVVRLRCGFENITAKPSS